VIRWLWLAVWGLIAVAVVGAVNAQPGFALARSPGAIWLEVAASGVATVAGLTVMPRARATGILLCLAGSAWLLAECNTPGAPGAIAFTAGIALSPAAPALVAHAALPRFAARLAGLLYASGLGVLGIVTALADDPRGRGCTACPRNLVNVTDAPGFVADAGRWGLHVGAVAAGAAALVLLWRRRSLASALFLSAVAVAQVHAWPRGFASNDPTERALWLVQAVALALIGAEAFWQRAAAERERARLAARVVELARSMQPEGMRDLLGDALGDRDVELLHAHGHTWIDADGAVRSAEPAPGRAVTPLRLDGETVAVLRHAPGLLDDPERIDRLIRVARLALVHEGLRARLRADLGELRASRARIVAVGDEERRRLERDLHDGAQQGLASLAMALGLAEGASDDDALTLARAHVQTALAELRVVAHGIFPPALTEAGLAAALDVLAEWSPALDVGAVPEQPLDARVEATAYFLVAACAATGGERVSVDAALEGDALVIDVETAAAPDLTEAEDRVGALDGTLTVQAPGTVIRATLPGAMMADR
jgi:signal transduction histidine kinase